MKNTGLPISFALSTNKTVSKIGTGESKPTGRLEVKKAYIQNFLGPLPIKKIPMVGLETFNTFTRSGVKTISGTSHNLIFGINQTDFTSENNTNFIGDKKRFAPAVSLAYGFGYHIIIVVGNTKAFLGLDFVLD